jgi:hypothetical protein
MREGATGFNMTRRGFVVSTGVATVTGVAAAIAGGKVFPGEPGGGTVVHSIEGSTAELPVYGPKDTLWFNGVEVFFDTSDPRFWSEDQRFDESWRWTSVPAFAMTGAVEQTRRFIHEVSIPNKRYDILQMIGLAGKIFSPYGAILGTYRLRAKAIFCATIDRRGRATKRLHQTLHHEFSSLLIHQGLIDIEEWEAVSGDVQYTHDMREEANLRTVGPADFENGFISVYGLTNSENDLNTFAAMLVTHPNKLFDYYAVRYPLMGRKARLLLGWYLDLGIKIPELNDEHLRPD